MSPKPRCKRQASDQEFLRGGGVGVARIRKTFFIFYFLGGGGGDWAQKIAEKMMRQTKNVAKHRWNSLKFPLVTFFLLYKFPEVGEARPRAWVWTVVYTFISFTYKNIRSLKVRSYVKQILSKYTPNGSIF